MSNKKNTAKQKDDAATGLVPKLRFPEFLGTSDWEQRYVEDFFNVGSSKRVLQQDWISQGIPFYRTRELVSLSKNEPFSSEIFISKSLFEEITQKYGAPQEGDFLVSGVGTLGISYLVKKGDEFYFKDGNVIWFSRKGGISSPFFNYCFESDVIQNQIRKQASVSTVGTYTIQNAKKTKFYCPPTEAEQQKIASCLSSLDELIVLQGRKVDALKTHKKGLMQQLFPREGETQPRLRFPEFQNAGEWEEKKLETVCDIQRGKFTHRPRNDPKFFGGLYPFIQTGDIVRSGGGAVIASQSLNEEGLAVSKLFKPTIVLITIAANIGDTGLLVSEGCFTDSVVGLIPKEDVIPVFLELIMRGQKENLNKVATTGAQKNINTEILREVCVLFPSVLEQNRIAACLSSLDDLITAETRKLEALKTHKRGVMQQLFPTPEEVDR